MKNYKNVKSIEYALVLIYSIFDTLHSLCFFSFILGEAVELTCEAEGDPRPTILWLNNGRVSVKPNFI